MVQPAHHSGLGTLNQRFPIWDLGAMIFWNPRFGSQVQSRGGPAPATLSYAGTSDYTYWHPGKGQFIEADPSPGPAVIPLDGMFHDERMNRYISSKPLNQRSFLFEAGLTVTNTASLPGVDPDHIILETSGTSPDKVRVQNFSGGNRRMYLQADSGLTAAGRRKVFSLLVRRNDHADVDANTVELGMSDPTDPFGPDIGNGVTRYVKIRRDGWFLVWRDMDEQATTQSYYWANWKNGVQAQYEAPQVEGDDGQIVVGTGASQTDILEPTSPVITELADTIGRTRTTFNFTLDEKYRIPSCGWMGCCVVPRSNYADHDSSGDGVPGSATILAWEIDANNRARWRLSNTDGAAVFHLQESGITQVFHQLTPADHVIGRPMGLVATWGFRLGSFYALTCLNGSVVELTTTLPSAVPVGSGEIAIGRGVNSPGTSPAQMLVQSVAIGNRALSRHDVRVLSRWFQTQGKFTMGPSAA